MKKSILFIAAIFGLLVSCEPIQDDISMPEGASVTEEELDEGFTYTQYEDEDLTTESSTGNYFYFTTNPATVVEIYQVDDEGSVTYLSQGKANGTFSIIPKRGADSNQTFYVQTTSIDGTVVSISKETEVYVPSELSTEMKIIASDSWEYKIWKWDTEFNSNGYVWGNAGYSTAEGSSWTGGIWWGATTDDDESTGLVGQLQHSDTGVITGEEYADAYMLFYDDGSLETYSASGLVIRSGKYSITNYDPDRGNASIDGQQEVWSLGTLTTDVGTILWPFQINGGGTAVGEFEIMELNANELQLIYAAEGTGNWSECTWWAFASYSDPDIMLTDYDTKDWTWDTEFNANGYVWGNCGYTAGTEGAWSGGIWWGATTDDDTSTGLVGQLQHSDTGEATGEELADAYMTFDYSNNSVKTYDGSGNLLRSGTWAFSDWGYGEYTLAGVDGTEAYAMGTLSTDAGSILWPFQINGGGVTVGDFEIVYFTKDQLQLVYAAEGTGNWSEATWWAFKAKE